MAAAISVPLSQCGSVRCAGDSSPCLLALKGAVVKSNWQFQLKRDYGALAILPLPECVQNFLSVFGNPASAQLLQLGSLRELSKQHWTAAAGAGSSGAWGQGQSLSCCSLPCSASLYLLESWSISSHEPPLPPHPCLPALCGQTPPAQGLFIIVGRSQIASNFG